MTIPLRISCRRAFFNAKLALCPAVTKGTLTRFLWTFLMVIGTKSSVLLGPCELAHPRHRTYQPHGIAVSNDTSIDNSGNDGSHVGNRKSVVDQKLGGLVNHILPMKRKDIEECSNQIDALSCDVGYSKDGTDLGSEFSLGSISLQNTRNTEASTTASMLSTNMGAFRHP